MSDNQKDDLCSGCEARCCRYVAIEIDKPAGKRDYDHIRWYLLHEGVSVFKEKGGRWYVEFSAGCSGLGEDAKCLIYRRRPRICRQYGEGEIECEFHAEEAPHEELFTNAAEYERYLDEKGIDWRWKRPRP